MNGPPLIVEDEALVSLHIEDQLIELGYEAPLAAATLEEAFAILSSCTPYFAVLDVNLRGERSYPIAHELVRRGTPFLFHTGYGPTGPLELFPFATVLAKPSTTAGLRDALATVLARCQSLGAENR